MWPAGLLIVTAGRVLTFSDYCHEQDQQHPRHLGHAESDRTHSVTRLTVRRNSAHRHGPGIWNKLLDSGGDGGQSCVYSGRAV